MDSVYCTGCKGNHSRRVGRKCTKRAIKAITASLSQTHTAVTSIPTVLEYNGTSVSSNQPNVDTRTVISETKSGMKTSKSAPHSTPTGIYGE